MSTTYIISNQLVTNHWNLFSSAKQSTNKNKEQIKVQQSRSKNISKKLKSKPTNSGITYTIDI